MQSPSKVSAVLAGILIALNRFLQETHGSKMAFLDGSPPERCQSVAPTCDAVSCALEQVTSRGCNAHLGLPEYACHFPGVADLCLAP